MFKIFIIEDDPKIRRELSTLLTRHGYECEYSDDFENIIDIALASMPDLLCIDINLPFMDGYFICSEIRKVSDVPIIMVTSRDTDSDELISMNLGADDFVTKPYNTQILLARIAALLKRTQNIDNFHKLHHKNVTLHTTKSKLTYLDLEIELNKNELNILRLLFANKENIVSRNDLMVSLWESDEFVDENTLNVNINRLRKKLEDIGLTDFLVTKRGQGYMI